MGSLETVLELIMERGRRFESNEAEVADLVAVNLNNLQSPVRAYLAEAVKGRTENAGSFLVENARHRAETVNETANINIFSLP